ncbi:hypothetical protein LNQ81_07615 [Myroides sp. M-43]|uniref:hypothetical protein n=1 Tax=Myroides oncorhynchi TaxID=2893756 RepID=UPI001E37554F|nr:hypothetical protein [Myroides oncorhynchi]MCC9042556.1 hypothetical protein [Myroides oncorhynchi]
MNRKSSKAVSLVLITAALASCSKTPDQEEQNKEQEQKVYMRADSSAPYTDVTQQYNQQRSHSGGGMGSALLWYMAFRPMMGGGMGYASQGLSHQANVGTNTAKSNAVKKHTSSRGGFGSTAKSSSASS